MKPCFTHDVRQTLARSGLGIAILLMLTGARAAEPAAAKEMHVLFIGNSFTGRHNLSQVIEALAEAGQPGLDLRVTTLIYGGRTLQDHWRLGSQNFVKIASLTREEETATIQSLREAARDSKDTYARAALARHVELLKSLGQPRPKWDFVVLQSYRDDGPDDTRYRDYAPRFAELVRAQGGRPVLYETTPVTQHEKALTAPPDPAPVLAKERIIADLGKRVDALVVPMAMVAHHCQAVRPDLTLRFVNDAHLNQTMAYLTACTFYAALFDQSPEGLPLDRVTDIRYLDNQHRDQDRDGGPITRVFSPEDRASLQRIAWEGLQKFRALAREGS